MRKFRIYGEVHLKIGNDYEIALIINDYDGDKTYEEASVEEIPRVECKYRFYDKIERTQYERINTIKFYRDDILNEICKFAKWKLRTLRKDRSDGYNPVLLVLAGKRAFTAMMNETYGSCMEQTGEIVVEMTASDGKTVKCRYDSVNALGISGSQTISVDEGEKILFFDKIMNMDLEGETGTYIGKFSLCGRSIFVILKVVQSISDLLNVMEECAIWEEKGWFR